MAIKVYIDPGHGGSDPGAVKYITEKNVNLVMAKACRDYLQAHGVQVRMSRTADTLTGINTMANSANSWGANYVISIHNNAGGGDGFEVYHHYGGGTGKTLAKNIEAEVKKIGQNSRGLKTRRDTDGSDYYGMIRLTNAPAVICEGVFVDNWADASQADTVAEQQAFGYAYARGILKTAGIKDKGLNGSSSSSSTSSKPAASTSSVEYYNTKLPQIEQGHKNEAVRAMQNLLIMRGYSCGSWGADSDFGAGTASAVKAFQKAKKLTVDGICGPNTWAKLITN